VAAHRPEYKRNAKRHQNDLTIPRAAENNDTSTSERVETGISIEKSIMHSVISVPLINEIVRIILLLTSSN
jgi:hypothetical protein